MPYHDQPFASCIYATTFLLLAAGRSLVIFTTFVPHLVCCPSIMPRLLGVTLYLPRRFLTFTRHFMQYPSYSSWPSSKIAISFSLGCMGRQVHYGTPDGLHASPLRLPQSTCKIQNSSHQKQGFLFHHSDSGVAVIAQQSPHITCFVVMICE